MLTNALSSGNLGRSVENTFQATMCIRFKKAKLPLQVMGVAENESKVEKETLSRKTRLIRKCARCSALLYRHFVAV